MVLLSKENDSNGCIGTVDISYPSAPIFLKYCPQLVNALCRGVLKFAEMPVWEEDYAPHDIGRYPYATGQVYAACDRSVFRQSAAVYPPYYLYPAGADAYNPHDQMPVEECGNMLIMLYAALRATGDASLIQAHRATLAKWAKYLCEYGEDPGEQLCTDDFARAPGAQREPGGQGAGGRGLLCPPGGDPGRGCLRLGARNRAFAR